MTKGNNTPFCSLKDFRGSDVKFVEDYLESKVEKDENYIVCTFYDLRIENNLSEEDVNEFFYNNVQKIGNGNPLICYVYDK